MRKPKEPTKPRKPSEPKEYLPSYEKSYSVYTGSTLAELLEATKGVDPKNVCFDATRGYYDDYDYQFTWPGEARPNWRYKKELAKFEADMVKYHKKMEAYENDLKTYRARETEYLKWFHQKELKKLG